MKIRNLIIAAVSFLALAACSQPQGKKVAVVYYSKTGNTQIVAEAIAKTLSDLTGDKDTPLFDVSTVSLTPVNPYPEDYRATIEESRDECLGDLGREIVEPALKDLEKYDVIFIGYPVWFGTYAPPVKSFIDANSRLAGKKIVPFCTYGTGGRISSVAKLAGNCPEATIVDSYGLSDKRLDKVTEEVEYFISSIAGKLLSECCEEESEDCCKGHDCTDGCCDKESWRELSEEDIAIFHSATENFSRMKLEPARVKDASLAGANRIYECMSEGFSGEKVKVEAYILVPSGGGKPELSAVER